MQPVHQQQHPTDAGGSVHQTHQKEELHSGERGLDGALHQQGQPGKTHGDTLGFFGLPIFL